MREDLFRWEDLLLNDMEIRAKFLEMFDFYPT